MNFLLRLVMSVGLIMTAVIIINPHVLQNFHTNSSYYILTKSSYASTCLLSFSKCEKQITVIVGLLIGSAIFVLFGPKFTYILAAVSVISWILIFANPFVSFSFVNFDWFLQSIGVVTGLLYLGLRQ